MKILFFDTETTGLPAKFDLEPELWFVRLVQLAFVQTVDDKPFKTYKAIIKPQGYEIPNGMIHGITNERALAEGVEAQEALKHFCEAWRTSDLIVCHNYDFDCSVIDSEYFQLKGDYLILPYLGKRNLPQRNGFCTMQTGTGICKLPGYRGRYKFPKLQELYWHLFGNGFEGAHDALSDVRATMDCFFELKRLGHVKI